MSKLYVAKSNNLSLAWAEIFFHLMEKGHERVGTGFDHDFRVRRAVPARPDTRDSRRYRRRQ